MAISYYKKLAGTFLVLPAILTPKKSVDVVSVMLPFILPFWNLIPRCKLIFLSFLMPSILLVLIPNANHLN